MVLHKRGVLRFTTRRTPTHWSRVDAQEDSRRIQHLFFEEWRLAPPTAIISLEGAANDRECCVLPAHEELALAHGLASAAQIANAWVIGSAFDAGAAQLIGRVLRSAGAAGVVSVGVGPWASVAQREELAADAEHRVFMYDAPRRPHDADGYDGVVSMETQPASGGQLSDGTSHLLLTDGGDPDKSSAANAKALRSAVEALLGQPAPVPPQQQQQASSSHHHHGIGQAPPAGCPKVLLVLGGGLPTLKAVLAALKSRQPVLVLPSSGFAAADMHEACTGRTPSGELIEFQMPRAVLDSLQRPDDEYRRDAPGLLRQIAKLGKSVRVGPHKQRALGFFRATSTLGLDDLLLRSLLAAAPEPMEALSCALGWRHASSLSWLLHQPHVGSDAAGVGAALERALLLKHAPSVEAMLNANAPLHLVSLDALCDDDRFRRATATATDKWVISAATIEELRKGGELTFSGSLADRKRPALCVGSAWGFALLQTVLDPHEEYTSLLRMRWRAALVAEHDGAHEPIGCDGEGALLLPTSLELMMWAVLCGEPDLARALWQRCEAPLRCALLASVVARAVSRSAGAATFSFAVAEGLARDADIYEGWAIGLLEQATDAEAHLMLLSTDAEYLGLQRSALELASDHCKCRDFCTHPKVSATLEKLVDGFIAPIPLNLARASGTAVAGCITTAERNELLRLVNPAVGAAEVRAWCAEIDEASALRVALVGRALSLYDDAQPPSSLAALVHPLRVPKVKHTMHALSSLAYLILLGIALCGLPTTADPALGAAVPLAAVPDPNTIYASEWIVWAWTATLLLEQAKHLFRVGVEHFGRKGTAGAMLAYLDDGAHLREFCSHLLLLLGGGLRLGTWLDAFDDGGSSAEAVRLRWVQTLYALGVLVVTSRFVGELACTRVCGVYACTLQRMLLELAPWLLVVACTMAAAGVALTVLLPGPTSTSNVWTKPALLPLLALLGAFDVEAALLDTTRSSGPFFDYPTDYVPPLLLLLGQVLLFLFLLSALIATLAGRYAAIAAAGEEKWCLDRLRFVREFKDERDALPPPFNALVLFCYDLPRLFAGAALSGCGRKRVQPGDSTELVSADGSATQGGSLPKPAFGLKLKATLPHSTIEGLQHVACECRDRWLALAEALPTIAAGAPATAASSDASYSSSLQLATLVGRLDRLDLDNRQHERLLRALVGADPEELLALRGGGDPERQATRHALHALHQASHAPPSSTAAKLPALPKKGLAPQRQVARLPTLQVAPSKPPSTQVVFGSALVPVHRVGPRLPGQAASGLEPPSMQPTDEQLGHLITPEIYRAFCLYGDRSFSGIPIEDGGQQLRSAIGHAAPRLRLGVAAERAIQTCLRASHLRVGLQAFGKLLRDLTVLHHQREGTKPPPSAAGGHLAASELGPEATLRAQQVFLRHDRDGSGDIDSSELRHCLLELELPASLSQIDAILRRYDRDQSGRIELPEFLTLVLELYRFQELALRAQQAFSAHDKDGSGNLDVAELKPALIGLGLDVTPSHVVNIMRRYDTAERDAKLDAREFLVLVRDVYAFQQLAIRADAVFLLSDVDKDGAITVSELQPALLKLGLDTNAAQVSEIHRRYDRDGNLRIDKLEFLALVKDLHDFKAATLPAPNDDVSRTFALYDRNLSGGIDVLELRDALSHLGLGVDTDEARRVLRQFDSNRNGQLELAEFRDLVEKLRRFLDERCVPPPPAAVVSDDVDAEWQRADEDRSGSIDIDELHSALQGLGLNTTYDQSLEVMKRYDTDKSGTLDRDEFRRLVLELRAFKRGADEVEAQFAAADADQSGSIELDELMPALARLEMPTDRTQCQQIFNRYDKDGSGSIDLGEFRQLVAEIRAFKARLAPKAVDDIETQWLEADEDRSGSIDGRELHSALQGLGLNTTYDQSLEVMKRYDTDKSGTLDRDEFRRLVLELRAFKRGADEVEAQFAAADADQSGSIELDELMPALARLEMPTDRSQAEAIFNKYDDDRSGSIDLSEFRRLVEEIRAFQTGRKPRDVLPARARDEIADEFSRADTSRQGSLTLTQLQPVLTRLGLDTNFSQAEQIFLKYDDDSSGSLELDEFRKMVEEVRAFQQRHRYRTGTR